MKKGTPAMSWIRGSVFKDSLTVEVHQLFYAALPAGWQDNRWAPSMSREGGNAPAHELTFRLSVMCANVPSTKANGTAKLRCGGEREVRDLVRKLKGGLA